LQARHRDKQRRVGESDPAREPHPRRRLKKKTSTKNRQSKWRSKRPAGEIPPLHVHALYRPGRLCVLFDIDKSTLTRWAKKGLLPPYTEINGVKGLTGQQIMDFYAQLRHGGCSDDDAIAKPAKAARDRRHATAVTAGANAEPAK
jgi:hypothetical protein